MVVRLGAAICAAVTIVGYSSSVFAGVGGASIGSDAAGECLIGSGKNLDARVVAYDPNDFLPMSAERGAAANEERSAPVRGDASTYNPYRPGWREGGKHTASGELYDPTAWTAAIKTSLREKFGGVRYGKDYRPVYALVEGADKLVIVKINDVGPLTPGRVIDLNERTMRYFDPTLQRGVIQSVKVTPLVGTYWTPGPVCSDGDLSRPAVQRWIGLLMRVRDRLLRNSDQIDSSKNS
jgi:rare lipoprotein A